MDFDQLQNCMLTHQYQEDIKPLYKTYYLIADLQGIGGGSRNMDYNHWKSKIQ
jgi:hypothetical protein